MKRKTKSLRKDLLVILKVRLKVLGMVRFFVSCMICVLLLLNGIVTGKVSGSFGNCEDSAADRSKDQLVGIIIVEGVHVKESILEELAYKFENKTVLREAEKSLHAIGLSYPKYGSNLQQVAVCIEHAAISADTLARHHGVVSLSLARPQSPDSTPATTENINKTSRLCDSLNVSVSAAGLENLTMSESLTDQLKAAFLQFCKRSTAQAEAIVEELFPQDDTAELVDSTLDRLVVGLSKDLIDDFPASDPRWVESLPQSGTVGVGSSMSLLVLHQLEDKLACNQFYITFLKSVGLWPRLAAITHRGQAMATVVLLAEHAEKTVGAVTLRTIHMDHQAVMDQAIRTCLAEREVTASGNLTDQNHFYATGRSPG